jgi:hypothetical protein
MSFKNPLLFFFAPPSPPMQIFTCLNFELGDLERGRVEAVHRAVLRRAACGSRLLFERTERWRHEEARRISREASERRRERGIAP